MCEVFNLQTEQEEIYARFLKKNNEQKNISAYPNPVLDILNVGDAFDAKNSQLISIEGKEFDFFYDGNKQIDLSHLESGMYFLKLTVEDSEKVIKFVKQ